MAIKGVLLQSMQWIQGIPSTGTTLKSRLSYLYSGRDTPWRLSTWGVSPIPSTGKKVSLHICMTCSRHAENIPGGNRTSSLLYPQTHHTSCKTLHDSAGPALAVGPVSSENRHPRKWAPRCLYLHEYGHPNAYIYGEYGHPAVKIGITLRCPYLQWIWASCWSGTKLGILMPINTFTIIIQTTYTLLTLTFID